MPTKGEHKAELCGDEMVVCLDYEPVTQMYTCNEMTESHIHIGSMSVSCFWNCAIIT